MPDVTPEVGELESEAGTPPAEDAESEVSETPSEEEGEAEAEGQEAEAQESDDDADDLEDEAEESESDESEPSRFATKKERDAWEDLVRKFGDISDEDAKKKAVANAYWRKARYAKQVRGERDELRDRLTRAEAELAFRTPKESETPAPPHPEVAKIDQAVAAIDQKIEKTQELQASRLQRLAECDREIAIAADRLNDAFDDDQKVRFKDRLEAAKERYETARQLYLGGVERLEDLIEQKNEKKVNKDWIERWQAQQQEQSKKVEEEKAAFKKNFPVYVDGMVTKFADAIGIPKDERSRESVWRNVNRALMVDIRAANVDDIGKLNIPGMVEQYVREFAEDRDIVRRSTFKRKSDEKLAVTTRKATPAGKGPGASVPASMRPAVPASLLATGRSPKMLEARRKLMRRFDT